MSDSLTPWILPYLLQNAETYGAQIFTIPFFEKKKKVQITEVSTRTYLSNVCQTPQQRRLTSARVPVLDIWFRCPRHIHLGQGFRQAAYHPPEMQQRSRRGIQ